MNLKKKIFHALTVTAVQELHRIILQQQQQQQQISVI
jgi:hypothetical protein